MSVRNLSRIKILILLCVLAPVFTFFYLDFGKYVTLSFIQNQQATLLIYYAAHRTHVVVGFFILYLLATAFSVPIATLLTLLSGALFGLPQGLILVSFSSTLGATCAFLMARFIAKAWVQARYATPLSRLENGFKAEGAFYLFALRLTPIFPFFLVNIIMGILPIRTRTFYWVSQCGMLPATAVYVYAGTQIAQIKQISDIASPSVLATFCLLGLFPLLAKKMMGWVRTQRHPETCGEENGTV